MDKLIRAILERANPSALGLDTRIEYFPEEFALRHDLTTFEGASKAIVEFNGMLIDALSGIMPAVKVQVAYYEMYGYYGMWAFYETLRLAKDAGMVVIADVKRNDIGSTAEAYSTAYLGSTNLAGGAQEAFPADIITVNPYLGSDGIMPFVKDCDKNDGGIFALVKTSNPSGGELQDLDIGGQKLYERVGALVQEWGKDSIGEWGYSRVGAVVGATYPEQATSLRAALKSVFFLLPGYGAQGATAKDLMGSFDSKGLGAVVNASRSILLAWKKDGGNFVDSARAEALRMKAELAAALNTAMKGDWR